MHILGAILLVSCRRQRFPYFPSLCVHLCACVADYRPIKNASVIVTIKHHHYSDVLLRANNRYKSGKRHTKINIFSPGFAPLVSALRPKKNVTSIVMLHCTLLQLHFLEGDHQIQKGQKKRKCFIFLRFS